VTLNPGGKVPALVVREDAREEIITESAAIVTWIGERFHDRGLVPLPESPERGQYLRWLEYRVPAVLETAKWEYGVAAAILETGLGDARWILGDRFSGADILLAHTIAWANKAFPEMQSEVLAEYCSRAMDRSAFLRARQRESDN